MLQNYTKCTKLHTRNSSVDEVGERCGTNQLPPEKRRGCDTIPPVTLIEQQPTALWSCEQGTNVWTQEHTEFNLIHSFIHSFIHIRL